MQAVELDGDVSLYDPLNRNALSLNPTASAIWRRLDGHADTADVITQLAAEFDVPSDLIAGDVVRTIEEFRAHGLLSPHPATPDGDE